MVRRAFSLVEVVLAVAIAGVLIVALLGLVRGGARTAAKAGEAQIAALVAGRVVDRLLTNDYRVLRGLVDRPEELELARLDLPPDAEPPADPAERKRLVVDGVAFTARYGVEEDAPGLLKITVTVGWQHPAGTPGSLTAARLVANPAVGLIVP